MALIHEKLYSSQKPNSIDFADYLRQLTGHLLRSYGARSASVKLEVIAESLMLDVSQAIPGGLIVNELVTNSLKHGFSGDKADGMVVVELRPLNGNKVELKVRDNGVGFPENLDFQNIGSLGLQIVAMLTKQIDGSIELSRTGGTEFRITFERRSGDSPR